MNLKKIATIHFWIALPSRVWSWIGHLGIYGHFGLIVYVGFVASVVLIAVLAWDIWNFKIVTRTWHTVDGMVIGVATRYDRQACVGPLPDAANCEEVVRTISTVTFLYFVDGIAYKSSQGIMLAKGYVLDALDPVPSRYTLGDNIVVYYDPTDPKTSLIYRNRSPLIYGVLFIASIFFLLLGAAIYLDVKELRKRKRDKLILHHKKRHEP